MPSRKNQWRKRGLLEFRRETKRHDDGTPWGHDVLYVRVHRKACVVIEPFTWGVCAPGKTVSLLANTYSAHTPVTAAKYARRYLIART